MSSISILANGVQATTGQSDALDTSSYTVMHLTLFAKCGLPVAGASPDSGVFTFRVQTSPDGVIWRDAWVQRLVRMVPSTRPDFWPADNTILLPPILCESNARLVWAQDGAVITNIVLSLTGNAT
jgi:hypothetical protein